MRFNFRKIASAAASTALIGSTVALAAAANYPEPFVKNGKADVGIVYGSHSAAVVDLSSAVDIANDLGGYVTGGSTGTGSDYVLLDKSSDHLNLGDAIDGPFGSTVNDDDLTMLADGTYTADDKDDFDYEQKITLGNINFTHFRDSDYEALAGLSDRTPVTGFKISSGTLIMNYTIDFLSDAESDKTSGDLEDFEGSDMMLFGKKYYVSDAKMNATDSPNYGKWTLLDSANTATIEEGDTITVSVGGKSYDVSIQFIDSDSTALTINGETTDDLTEGTTEKLSDGTYVGIRDVRKLEVSGETGSVEFSLGSGKLEITSGSDIKLNDDAIEGVKAWIVRGNPSGGAETLDKIVVEWINDDETFLGPDLDLTVPGFGGLKFTQGDLVRPTEEVITLENDGDDSMAISLPIEDGDATFNLLFADATGNFTGLGKASDERLATSSNSTINFIEKLGGNDMDTWFVATYNTTDDAESYLLKATVTEDSNDGRNETTITNVVTGDACEGRAASDECTFGDVTLTINSVYVSGDDEWVNIAAGSNVNFNTIFTKGGLKFYLPVNESTTYHKGAINFSGAGVTGATTAGYTPNSWYLFMDEEDKDDNKASGLLGHNFTIDDNSDNDLQVSQVGLAGSGGTNALEIGDTNAFELYLLTDIGTKSIHYTNPDQDYVEIYYPAGSDGASETYVEVYLSSTDTGDGTTTSGVPSVKDNEVSSVSSKNLIVLGGSCVNSVAASLLGSSSPMCGAAWETATGVGSGSFLIQSFESPYSSSKVALLVAGYGADDTENAAKALTTQDIDTAVGNKYTGVTSTSVTLV